MSLTVYKFISSFPCEMYVCAVFWTRFEESQSMWQDIISIHKNCYAVKVCYFTLNDMALTAAARFLEKGCISYSN